MSQQPDSSSSLLSLSIAAANAHPIPVAASNSTVNKHHRRLSSAGKTRRRLSDARDAANRPTSTAAAALSLASLSLSSSPPPTSRHLSTSLGTASNVLAIDSSSPTQSINLELSDSPTGGDGGAVATLTATATTTPIPIANGKNKKRGVDHKCETCSKIYRHPSCLIKHRWEHTPHWREASKYVLSKHQQVQLLEAAAILSHLSPSSSSLPDDRSLWPSFLSGGSLPPPEMTSFTSYSPTAYSNDHTSTSYNPGYSPRQTNSVPALGTNYYRSPPSSLPNSGLVGPRLHDYPLSGSDGISGDPAKVGPGAPSSPISGPARVPTTALPKAPSTQVPPLAEEEEDPSNFSSRDCALSTSPEQRRSRSRSVSINSRSHSRSRSQSVSVSDEEMSPYTDQDKLWRGFAGRRYTDIEDLDEGVDWNDAYGRRIGDKGKVAGQARERVQEEWDGFEMDMEMD